MKILTFLACVLIISGCSSHNTYRISNDSDREITDKTVVLTRAEVNGYLKDNTSSEVLVARLESGDWLPTQCDDLDGDGSWDELAFLCNLKAGETIGITFEKPGTPPQFPVRTNIRFGRMTKPFEEVTGDLRMKTNDTRFTAPVYQMEGPAWENDVIAFRNYYDARNGIDIFGKTTKELILDSVGVNGRDYHTLADWGMDILKVGNSLGAGAIAIGIGDSLFRVGPCEEGTYRLISEGPVRAILELDYKNVPAGDRKYNVKHRITINAADRFYGNAIWVNDLKGDETLVTGIVDLHNIPADTLTADQEKIIFTLGNQAYDGELLGMAVLSPAGMLNSYGNAPAGGPGIVNTYLVKLNLYNDRPTQYRFMAVWENENPQIKDIEYFKMLLVEAAGR